MWDLVKVHVRALIVWDGKLGRMSYFTLQAFLLVLIGYTGAILERHSNWTLDKTFVLAFFPLVSPRMEEVPASGIPLAIPYLWFSFLLAVKRLRDIEWDPRAALVVFVPLGGLVLATLFCIVPGRGAWERGKSGEPLVKGRVGAFVPRDDFGSGVLAVVVSCLVSYGGMAYSIYSLSEYGLALFCLLPVVAGFVSSVIYGFHTPRTYAECFKIGLISALIQMGLLVFGGAEGIICLIMASPLIALGVLAGSSMGYFLQLRPSRKPSMLRAVVPIVLWPLIAAAERDNAGPSPLIKAQTSILINAPPETVWKNVITFSELPTPNEFVFRTGIAYPIRATIDGQGPGAIRRCTFTTGDFVEPIEVWDEPSLLRFKVTQNPPVMKELNPFGEVDAPHLHGFFESRQGQFQLQPMPGGRTLLIGTTWYQHRIEPQAYWKLWSDEIIHAIHSRVLSHIKALSEKEEAAGL